jgi:hypothetical protein
MTENNLALLLDSAGRPAEAEPLFARALRSFAAALPLDHPKVVACAENYAGLLRAQDGEAAAAALLRQYGRGGDASGNA